DVHVTLSVGCHAVSCAGVMVVVVGATGAPARADGPRRTSAGGGVSSWWQEPKIVRRMSLQPVLGPVDGTRRRPAGEVLVEDERLQTASGAGGIHLIEDLLGGRHPAHLIGAGDCRQGQKQD